MTSSPGDRRNLPIPAGVLPFFFTAPIAVAAAGVMLLTFADRALSSNWSPLTMSLTHLATLGFLSMTLIGAFYLLVPLHLNKPIEAARLPLFVYATFTIAVGALCIGLGGVAVTPVFVAIGAFFLALIGFFWTGFTALRGTRKDPRANALRLAIGSFLIAASIGVWVAHGHGGMKFPGPRGLWIQVHLAIALFGWVGGMTKSAFDWISRPTTPDVDPAADRIEIWWGRLVLIGVVASSLLLALQYVGLIDLSIASASWIGAAAVSPLAIAGCLLQPLGGLRRLRSPSCNVANATYWRTAFWLAPLIAFIAPLALASPAPQWRLTFGWLALWGWGGLMVHALWRELPGCLFPRVLSQQSETPDLAYALHVLSLLAGVVAISTGSAVVARLTGLLLLALALQQTLRFAQLIRVHRSALGRPG